jgi:hypothetical protein
MMVPDTPSCIVNPTREALHRERQTKERKRTGKEIEIKNK